MTDTYNLKLQDLCNGIEIISLKKLLENINPHFICFKLKIIYFMFKEKFHDTYLNLSSSGIVA